MESESGILSAAELDAMTPNERRDAFRGRIVRDADAIPDELRTQILATARQLATE